MCVFVCVFVSLCLCFFMSLFLCVFVSLFLCFYVSLFLGLVVWKEENSQVCMCVRRICIYKYFFQDMF